MKTNKKETVGLYLHFPFCLSRCRYCDFCTRPHRSEEEKVRYADRLCEELSRTAKEIGKITVDSVYFGGGTPTVMPLSAMEKVISCLRENFTVEAGAEFTVECNPKTADKDYFRMLRNNGVNRLSVGCQSLDPLELRTLGRIHTADDFFRTVGDAHAAGFENLSADLMLGIPYQTKESLQRTLDGVLSCGLSHLSAYDLQWEEGTDFYRRREELPRPTEEEAVDLWHLAHEKLAAAGFSHYEISNFALPGRESRHNLRYWRCGEYLGFGPAAHSYFHGVRWGNRPDPEAFLRGETGQDFLSERTVLSDRDRENEYLMLGLRLAEGISFSEYAERFAKDFLTVYGEKLTPFLRAGLVLQTEKGIRLSPDGWLVSNSVLSELID